MPSHNPFFQTEQVWQALGVDRSCGYQTLPAGVVSSHYYPPVEVSLPLLITPGDPAAPLALIQRALVNAYPGNHELILAYPDHAGVLHTGLVPLQHLGEQAVDPANIWLYVPPLPAHQSFTALQNIVAHLRSPAGCPWDRQQTLPSMRHDLLGECAEVLEAIDAATEAHTNDEHIAEELGDLLMAAALIVQIATEAGRFRLGDAMQSVVTKLIRRHPHVFGATTVDGVEAVLTNWDAIKAQEKAAKGLAPAHPLDGVPTSLPALEKARQLQSKAQKVGLLPRSTRDETVAQLQRNLAQPLTEEKLGEGLWQIVHLARADDLNPEDALRHYSVRFKATAAPIPTVTE